MTWRATVLTLFPEMFPGPLGVSLAGQGADLRPVELEARDIGDSATDRHRSVDDTPAGGGLGMVLPGRRAGGGDRRRGCRPGPAAPPDEPARSAVDPGRVTGAGCGARTPDRLRPVRGVDQRVIDGRNLEEVSIGDYVLSGGEIAAMALIDACVRLLPGVMGKQASGERRKLLRRTTGIPPIHPAAGVRGPRRSRRF